MTVVRDWFTCGFLGTSWVGGRLSTSWVERLARELPLQPEAKGPMRLYNLGQGGFTSSQILAQKVPLLTALRPNHVFIDPGHVNSSADSGAGPAVSRAQTIADIDAMVGQIRAAIPGVNITLCTMHSLGATSLSIHPAYYDYVEDLKARAAILDVPVLNTNAAWPKPLDPTLTYGAAPFSIAPTAGYSALPDGAGWNPADASASVVLSPAINEAFAQSTAVAGVRGNMPLTAKMHFETTIFGKLNSYPCVGVSNLAEALNALSGANSIVVGADGNVYAGGANQGAVGFSIANGDVVGVEFDPVAKLVYFMKGATRSAGFSTVAIAGAIYPCLGVNAKGGGGAARFTPNGDGLHPNYTGAVDTYHYPAVLAWARAKLAAFWP